jgi:hypothetical protein
MRASDADGCMTALGIERAAARLERGSDSAQETYNNSATNMARPAVGARYICCWRVVRWTCCRLYWTSLGRSGLAVVLLDAGSLRSTLALTRKRVSTGHTL